MTDFIILGVILIINLIGTIVFVFLTDDKHEKKIAIFFLILPVFGFILFFFMLYAMKKNEKKAFYDRENLVAKLVAPDEVKRPKLEDELSVVSISDALSVSTNQEKRELILNQLKKENQSSYKALLIASRDEDSETAHYVATAKVSAYEKTYDTLRTMKNIYSEVQIIENLLNLLSATSEIVKSGVLSIAEQSLYNIEYCNLIEQNMSSHQIPEEYFEDYVDFLIQLERTNDLVLFWEKYQSLCNSEFVYFRMLKFFYQSNDRTNFFITLQQIKNSKISLSSDGLDKLRFWMKRGGK